MKRALLAALLLSLGSAGHGPLAFVDLDGKTVQLARAAGAAGAEQAEEAERADESGALILHFWATWCPTCITEMAALDAAVASCAERAVRVVAVNVGEDQRTVRRYWAEHKFGLRVVRDPEGRQWRRLGGTGLPLNLIWSRDGRRSLAGPRDAEAWRGLLTDLGC